MRGPTLRARLLLLGLALGTPPSAAALCEARAAPAEAQCSVWQRGTSVGEGTRMISLWAAMFIRVCLHAQRASLQRRRASPLGEVARRAGPRGCSAGDSGPSPPLHHHGLESLRDAVPATHAVRRSPSCNGVDGASDVRLIAERWFASEWKWHVRLGELMHMIVV